MLHAAARLLAAVALCASFTTRATPGDLDTAGFGSGFGKVLTSIDTNSQAEAVALQPDGRIVAAGACSNGNGDRFCLARYLPNGALDTSFNGTGTVITTIGSSLAAASAVAVQRDGKIVAAGACSSGSQIDFCLARYLPDGTLDPGFNGTGKVNTPLPFDGSAVSAIVLQPDGRIVVAGSCLVGGPTHFCAARYLANGPLDLSFGSIGVTYAPIGDAGSTASAVALQPDGKILIAGMCRRLGANAFCVARISPDTALFDTAFGFGGTVTTTIAPGVQTVGALALQADGKIVVGGTCFNGSNNDFCIARYLASGTLDTTFNYTGVVISAIGSGEDIAHALALQPDGKIVVAGTCRGSGFFYDFCVSRYLGTGERDYSFINGRVMTDIGAGDDDARAIVLQPDGKMVVAGVCYNANGTIRNFCLARYQGGPFEARNCALDIDGDNQVLATTDILISARVALGMSGNAVLNGITFAPHATRTTWPAIRDYLVTQCGMSITP